MILWTYAGTFNFEELFSRLRAPEHDVTHELPQAYRIISADRVNPLPGDSPGYMLRARPPHGENGSEVILFPRDRKDLRFGTIPTTVKVNIWERVEVQAYDDPGPRQFGHMPYWALVVAGLGLFLGCVGKSAQFPLQVWLPDAMEGPTPVSALIHAATMVAAGVYLVARIYPVFTREVLLVIAYTGAITLFVAATVAVVMTDIKKVLAYSTVSQLGYMMLGLGVGGWVAGSFHLITHAFFKALLFLCSGSVIYGCHHQQDMLKMGGLYPKMKITAITMLIGVLAISGVPMFSGWFSKDAIIVASLAFASFYKQHALLFALPLVTAGLTTFYMFRMWFMTFTGPPRDAHVHEHAHESPWLITVPLIVLAGFSIFVAWGLPPWDSDKLKIAESELAKQLERSMPMAVHADFDAKIVGELRKVEGIYHVEEDEVMHTTAGGLALLMVVLGVSFAWVLYYKGLLDPADAKDQFPGVHRFLTHKWWFDEFYSAAIVRPGLVIARWASAFDTYVIDGIVHAVARGGVLASRWSGNIDRSIVDGLVNVLADVWYGIGSWLRGFQTGYLRSYVLFLALAAIAIWLLLVSVWGVAIGGP
jgi:NADH-quinone oxidoreductase subunit L